MKYLGIDYGSKRVGTAVSDDAGTLAFPKKVIQNKGSSGVAAVVAQIQELCTAEKIGELVIGDSRDYHGRPNEIMKEIEAFSVLLQEEIKLPVHFQLEFMSSIQASRGSAAGKPVVKRGEKSQELKGDASLLDASAAAIILQSFLDKKKA